jgi:hypothetical protein
VLKQVSLSIKIADHVNSRGKGAEWKMCQTTSGATVMICISEAIKDAEQTN